MSKSKCTTDILTQIDIAAVDNMELFAQHNGTEMKTVESFEKHSIFLLLAFFFYKNIRNKSPAGSIPQCR